LISKRSQLFNFFLRQIQGVSFHAAIGAVDQGNALQFGQTQHRHCHDQRSNQRFNQGKSQRFTR